MRLALTTALTSAPTTGSASTSGSTFRALVHPDYRRYASGGVVSNVGTWMQRVAQDWLVLQLSGGSGAALGIVTGLQFLPILLLSPYAGAVADRFPKRRLLQLAQIAMATPAVVLGTLAVTGLAELWHVYVIALAFGVATAFEAPVRQSFVSELVPAEDLSNAVGLNSASFNAGRIVGPAVAGLMIALLGSGVRATGVVILVNAASYGAVLVALSRVRAQGRSSQTGDQRGTVRDGIRYVRSRPDLLLVLSVMFFVGTFGLNFQLTSALMATEVYGKGAGEYGILGSAMAVGSITGALLAARRGTPRLRLVVLAALVFCVVEVVLGLMPTYLSFIALSPLLGVAAMTTITSANTTVQLTTPAELRGRVMALYLMVFMGGTPIGSPLVGAAAEAFGPRWSLIGGALVAALGTLGSLAVFLRLTRARASTGEPARGADAPGEPSVGSAGAPPLPAPGDPRRAAAAHHDRRGGVGGSWLSTTATSRRRSHASGRSSSTTSGSSGRSRPVGAGATRSRPGDGPS